jgi:hypothetical protein
MKPDKGDCRMSTRQNKWVRLVVLLLSSTPLFAANPIFYASYNTSVNADLATGSATGTPSTTLPLIAGVLQNALTVGVENAVGYWCSYNAQDNIHASAGTVAFWVKPVDWEGTSPGFHLFFQARGMNSLLYVYKFHDVGDESPYSGKLLFLYGPSQAAANGSYQYTIISSSIIQDWVSGEWHHIACSWNTQMMKLYIDGVFIQEETVKVAPVGSFDTLAVGGYQPETWGSLPAGKSLIDEVKIYATTLTDEEIYQEWNATRPATSDTMSWDGTYEATVLPTEDGWSLGNGYSNNYATVSGGVLTIDSMGTNTAPYWKRTDVAFDFDRGVSLEFRMKFNEREASVSYSSCNFQISNSNYTVYIELGTDRVNMSYLNANGAEVQYGSYAMDTTNDFHIYRLAAQTGTNKLNFYVDNTPIPVITGTLCPIANGTPILSFGDGTGAADARYELTYLRWTTHGAVPAVATRSSNSWEGAYEANVLPNSTGWMLGNANSNNYAAISGGVLTINSMGTNTAPYWKRTDVAFDFNNGVSLEFQLKFDEREASVSYSSCNFQISNLNYTAYIELGTDRINVSYLNANGVEVLYGSYSMNTSDTFHTYRLTARTGSNNLNLYIDNDVTPVITGTLCPITNGTSILSFGDGTGAADAKYELDYLRWTTQGVFGAKPQKDNVFQLRYLYTNLQNQTLNLGVHQPCLDIAGEPIRCRVRLLNDANNVALETSTLHYEHNYDMSLNIATLPPATYTIEISFLDVYGNTLVSPLTESYTRYGTAPSAWANNQIGITTAVPAPWTPMTVSNNSVHCWGRDYIFQNNLLPSQIVSQGKNLLISPMRLAGTVAGQSVEVSNVTLNWVEQQDNKVRLITSGQLGPISISAEILIEYDGFMWIKLMLNSSASTSLDQLFIEIPLTKAYATLRNFGDYRMERSGILPDSAFSKDLREKPIFWLGCEEVGVQWFAEGLANWSLQDFAQSIVVTPQSDRVLARLNIIDASVPLQGSKEIDFGFQATPVKPQPAGWRSWRFDTDYSTTLPSNIIQWYTEWTELFNYPDLSQITQKGWNIPSYTPRGITVCPYLALSSATPHSPEYAYYGELWRTDPSPWGRELTDSPLDPQTREWAHYLVCGDSSDYRDFYLWKLQTAVTNVGLKGAYFDYGVPFRCQNGLHGCGWHDGQGALQRTYPILGTRELAKRIYVMMKQQDPNALLLYHMSGEVAMPVHAFADVMVDGENLTGPLEPELNYYNILPLDKFKAEYMARQWGPVVSMIPEFRRAASFANKTWPSAESPKAVDHLIGLSLVHDGVLWPYWGVNLDKLWQVFNEFVWNDQVQFLPYWNNSNHVTILSPQLSDIVVSIFERPERIMVVPLNNIDNDITLRIQLANFSLNGNVLVDKYNNNDSFTINNNGIVEFPLGHRSFRMLIIEKIPPGDFSHDGVVDGWDIDALYDVIKGRSTSNPAFDLDSNGVIDQDDMDYLIHLVLKTQYGDANCDGKVDVGDLGILASNYGQQGKTWNKGDFNGDRLVDVGDLGILAASYGWSTNQTLDFKADYAKAFGTTQMEDDSEDHDEVNDLTCSRLGLPLILSLVLIGLMRMKLDQ